MEDLSRCPDCEAEIPEDAPLGMCPSCLLGGSFEEADEDGNSDSGSELVPGYRILKKIGEGGFAEVFEADQYDPVKRKVALKILRREISSPRVLARFEGERQALAMMDHPHIATVFSAGETKNESPFVAMELVEGTPITDFCRDNNLDRRQKLDLMKKVCEAVHHAHLKGIIHRDLKPSNVLVTTVSGEPVPKVIDFGIARALDESLTDRTVYTDLFQLVGTPGYMSPEQATLSAGPVDARSDIYSLGVLLYEILAEEAPFPMSGKRKDSVLELLRLVREEEPARLSSHSSALKGEVEWVTRKAMAKDPEDRYGSASALGEDLGRILEDRPVSAGSPPPLYFFRLFVKRHRTMVAAASIAVIALVSGLIVASIQYGKATRLGRDLVESESELRESFRDSDYRMALQLHERRRTGDAIAHLCRALKTDPEHYPSASCLLSILAHDQFYKVAYPPLKYPQGISSGRLPVVGHTGKYSLFIGDGEDGERIVVSDLENAGTQTFETGFEGAVRYLSAADDSGRFLISDGASVELRSSDAPTEVIQKFETEAAISAFVVDSTERRFALGTEPGAIQMWDLEGTEPEASLKIGGSSITALQFTRNARTIAYGNGSGFVGVWDPENGRHLWNSVSHTSPISALAVGVGGGPVASGDESGIVQIFLSGRMISTTSPMHHSGEVRVLALESGSQKLFSGDSRGVANFWDPRSGRLESSVDIFQRSVNFVRKIRAGGKMVLAEEEGSVRVVDPESGRGEALAGGGRATAVATNTEGDALVVLSDLKKGITLFDLSRPSSHPVRTEALPVEEQVNVGESGEAHIEARLVPPFSVRVTLPDGIQRTFRGSQLVTSAAMNPDGRRLAILTGERTIQLFDVYTEEALTPKHRLQDVATAIRFTGNEEQLTVVGERGDEVLWSIPPEQPKLMPWFLTFCERIGGRKISDGGQIRAVDLSSLSDASVILNEGVAESGQVEYRYARWLVANMEERTLSPGIPMKVKDYVERLISTGDPLKLRESLLLDPGNTEATTAIKNGALKRPVSSLLNPE